MSLNKRTFTAFKIEFDSRNRIFQESMSLIYSTKNIETLHGRYETANEHLQWILRKKLEGFPVSMNHDQNTMLAKLNEEKNNNILRIANLAHQNFEASRVSTKSIERANLKFNEAILKCLKYLVHSKNYDSIRINIEKLLSLKK